MTGPRLDSPRHRRSVSPAIRSVTAVAWVTAVLLVAEIVRANLSAGQQSRWPWRLRLLGIPTTASLLATALVTLLVRDQLARSVAPLLSYVSQWVSAAGDLTGTADRYRQVILRNVGPGTAVVAAVTWRLGVPPARDVEEVRSMVALRERLALLDLKDGVDYTIDNYSPGSALASGEERLYFECTDAALAAFTTFDAVFGFESLAGDRYDKTISLLPRPGASTATASP
jgi:hypothetical protein